MSPLLRRREVTQATLDHWKGRPFAWGSADCAQMVRRHLEGMGHKVKLAKVGSYSTAIGAKRAIHRLGYPSLIEAMDARFLRIAPAATLPGDILALPADEGEFGALVIALGNGAALGWHPDAEGAAVMRMEKFVAAWPVYPA
jgi:hypothetical protein